MRQRVSTHPRSTRRLCETGPTTSSEPAGRCQGLPEPRIRTPLVGDHYVVVTDAIPGARIRVYDQTGDELGDGSGTVILLKRVLTGADTLTVIQQLGDCVSRTDYRISVRNPDWKREQ